MKREIILLWVITCILGLALLGNMLRVSWPYLSDRVVMQKIAGSLFALDHLEEK